MPQIRVLPEDIANKIAAGEVIERPASVVKELMENAIDAGATQISVTIRNAGKNLIQVVDNGCGMNSEDAKLSFERHATSKIKILDDLFSILTLGFRGEALPSIASISKIELITRTSESVSGTRIEIEGGQFLNISDYGAPVGTSFSVYHLFYNTPARLKFMRTDATENNHIINTVTHLALSCPEIGILLMIDNREIFNLPPVKSLRDRVIGVLGKELDKELLEVNHSNDTMQVKGFIARPAYTRLNWSQFMTYVNGRLISSKPVNSAVLEGYHGFLMTGRYPAGILFIQLDPRDVDVNVHPSKREVRFNHENQIKYGITDAVKNALQQKKVIPEIQESFVASIETLKTPLLQPQPVPKVQNTPTDKPDFRRPDFNQLVQKALSKRTVQEKPVTPVASPTSIPSSQTITAQPVQKELNISIKKPLCAADQGKSENLSEVPEPALFETKLPDLIPLAQLDETYIICRSGNDLLIIDQHAAHERILFDKLLPKMENFIPSIQPLLIPVLIELTPRESSILEEYRDIIESLGIEIEALSSNTYAIRTMPQLLDRTEPKEILRDILDSIIASPERTAADQKRYHITSVISCRAAIKAGDIQKPAEWQNLIKELQNAENPYTCPHGRPTIIRLTKSELEKRFKRTGA